MKRGFCQACGAEVDAVPVPVRHLRHAALSLLTCAWAVVWAIKAAAPAEYRCPACGGPVDVGWRPPYRV